MTPPPSTPPPPPPPPPEYPTNESRGIAAPFPKEEGNSKLHSSSHDHKNARRSSRRKRLRDDSPDKQTRRCSAVALAYWNKNLKPDGVPEYVLLELVTSVAFLEPPSFCLHANFKAKPKSDHSAEAELFFAELKGNIYKKKAYKVTNVCKLGPSDSVSSGLNSCKACVPRDKEDLPIHHPEGGFNVGHWVNTID